MVTLAKPTSWVTVEAGLAAGVLIWALTPKVMQIAKTINSIFFILILFAKICLFQFWGIYFENIIQNAVWLDLKMTNSLIVTYVPLLHKLTITKLHFIYAIGLNHIFILLRFNLILINEQIKSKKLSLIENSP